jgi:hypothetical protein
MIEPHLVIVVGSAFERRASHRDPTTEKDLKQQNQQGHYEQQMYKSSPDLSDQSGQPKYQQNQ